VSREAPSFALLRGPAQLELSVRSSADICMPGEESWMGASAWPRGLGGYHGGYSSYKRERDHE
jgi:hypothetical protein